MSTSQRSPRAKPPTWDQTLVSFDLGIAANEGSGGRDGPGSAPRSTRAGSSHPAPTGSTTSTTSPGKLVATHRAPRKSGFYTRVDPYAGLEQLDREELDEADEDGAASIP